jgi:hypothetical protein
LLSPLNIDARLEITLDIQAKIPYEIPEDIIKNKDFCEICTASTINKCQNPKCNSPIPGYKYVSGIIGDFPITTPLNACRKCGNKFPWADKFATHPSNDILVETDVRIASYALYMYNRGNNS